MNQTAQAHADRPLWQRITFGVVVGAGSALMLFSVAGDISRAFRDPGFMLAVIAGLCYCLMGTIVGAGLLAPKAGARFLNVDNAEEIKDERAKLWPSAVSCILVGLFFLALAFARTSLPVGHTALPATLAVCAVTVTALTIATRHRWDELTRRMSIEASALTLHLAFVLFGGWAVVAHLGFVGWMSPLAFLAGLALLMLVAIFWVGARKGLMTPR